LQDPCQLAERRSNPVSRPHPGIGVHRTFGIVLLKAGRPWPGRFVGNTDALAIGVRGRTTVYDFEPGKSKKDKH